ncbi:hypothetical protein EVAR_23834_1 [Eumeta japonica]|uniref:Uncharacterized protein n=1 Tax=Eumeta variegata TaxID=151549 RepID=A0A4C1VLH4_EUMVA|nr:hypothetical protein EVAR_23834_1 [Eumeta japonica]
MLLLYREFNLVLRPDPRSVFAEGAQFHSTRGRMRYDTAHVYTGTLEDTFSPRDTNEGFKEFDTTVRG